MGECFFSYRLTRLVPDKKAIKWLCVFKVSTVAIFVQLMEFSLDLLLALTL